MKQELDWAIRILRTINGFVIEHDVELSDGSVRTERTVFEESSADPLEDIEKVLWAVIDVFDKFGSKHDKERICITREAGNKYEDTKEGVKKDE